MPANAIHIPEELVARIDAAREIKGGYSNRAEFVREAIRLRCDQIEADETHQRDLEIAEVENGKGEKTKKRPRGTWP